jgi:hypothetical protein
LPVETTGPVGVGFAVEEVDMVDVDVVDVDVDVDVDVRVADEDKEELVELLVGLEVMVERVELDDELVLMMVLDGEELDVEEVLDSVTELVADLDDELATELLDEEELGVAELEEELLTVEEELGVTELEEELLRIDEELVEIPVDDTLDETLEDEVGADDENPTEELEVLVEPPIVPFLM